MASMALAEALNSIGDPTIELNLYRAIVEYGLNGTRPNLSGVESAIFTLITPQIDANQRRYENGKKGGRPKKGEEKRKELMDIINNVDVAVDDTGQMRMFYKGEEQK